MTHLSEEQLIAYQDGERTEREAFDAHLATCAECRTHLERIAEMLAAYQALPVPDPGDDFGGAGVATDCAAPDGKRAHWWDVLLEPRRLAVAGLVAALLLVAFLAGRVSKRVDHGDAALSAEQVRQKVLMLAVGEHLGRSEMVLMEIANAGPETAGVKQVNISSQRRRAEDLLDENRLYRQTAVQEGDTGLANVLDELERVLLDVAHSPQTVTPAQFKSIRQRIDDDGLLFKVRVLSRRTKISRKKKTRPAGRHKAAPHKIGKA